MDNIFEQIKNFVIQQRWEYDFKLERDTEIESELRITGDDAVEFILEFGKKFNVDVSKFNLADYFEGEGVSILGSIFDIFSKRNNTTKSQKLTLGHLEKAVIAGKLDDSIMNNGQNS